MVNVWGINPIGKSDKETALVGIEALESLIREIDLSMNLQELGVGQETDLKVMANSCVIVLGNYKRMIREEVYEIFKECR